MTSYLGVSDYSSNLLESDLNRQKKGKFFLVYPCLNAGKHLQFHVRISMCRLPN